MPKFLRAVTANQPIIVRTSIQHIKGELKNHPGTEWRVDTYNEKFDLATVCKLLEDLSPFKPIESLTLRVTDSGTCRKI